MKINFLAVIILFVLHAQAQVTILSGVNGGSYQVMANDISKISDTVLIEVQTSNGSMDNFRRLMDNEAIDFAFIQEDVLFHQQLIDLEEGTNNIDNIRVALEMGYEEIHLVARTDGSINTLADLNGKSVAVGAKTSGTAVTAGLIKEMVKGTWNEVYMPFDSLISALLSGRIDAFFSVGAVPMARFSALPAMTGFKLVPINDPRLTEIYHPTKIAANAYRWHNTDVATVGVRFLLVTNSVNADNTRQQHHRSMLACIKRSFAQLQTQGHPKWKEVQLDFETSDWQVYEVAQDVFVPNVAVDHVIIASGVEGGSYFRIANDIKSISDSVEVKPSKGSLDNFHKLITRDEAYVTFLQYDVLESEKMKDLQAGTNYTNNIRILLPLADEEIHIVTLAQNGILDIKDLKKRKVGIGTVDQGTYVTANLIKDLTGIKWIDVPLPLDSSITALINKEIDAFFFVGSAPVARLADVPDQAGLRLVSINDDRLKVVYQKTTFNAGVYSWNTTSVNSYAVKSVLATNITGETTAQRNAINTMLNDIHNNTQKLQEDGHPKWKTIKFTTDGVKWPVYDLAKQIFKSNR